MWLVFTPIWRSFNAKKPPKRLVRPWISRQSTTAAVSCMTGFPPQGRQSAQRIARENAIRPDDHHDDQDDAVDDEPLGILEIEKLVQELVDAVHRVEARPRHRQQLQPFAQRPQ